MLKTTASNLSELKMEFGGEGRGGGGFFLIMS